MTTIKAGTTITTAFSVAQDTTGDLVFQTGNVTPLTIANTGVVNIADTAAFKVPVGGLNDRPATPANGMLRYNTDYEEFEGYSNRKWNLLTQSIMTLKLDFDEITALPAGISFTRATNGTFFNSAGVLTTAGSGVARFDHRLEGGVWKNKGLLIEEQRTNITNYSEEINDAYWVKSAVTITANDITAPDGTTTADKLLETTANAGHAFSKSYAGLSVNTLYSLSGFVKGGLGRDLLLVQFAAGNFGFFITVNISTGVVDNSGVYSANDVLKSAEIQDVGNGWYRVSITGSISNLSTNPSLQFRLNNGSSVTYAGDVTKGFYAWGVQLELGAFPTSYIATTSATVTRNADVVSMTGTDFSSWYNASEGTTFWQGDIVGSSAAAKKAFSVSDNSANERMVVSVENSSGNGFVASVIDGNSSQASLETPNPATARTANQTYKHSFAYKVNDFAASLDGGSVQTDTSGTLPTVNRIYLGSNNAGTSLFLNGHIAKFYYWNKRRPNEFLQLITE
jgi:hypothetical protein